ncbi:34_t:CDS:2, partial [Ambispora gerdemannii]
VNGDTNIVLLMQIQDLTNILQEQTVKDNINNIHSLLATHKYLPGEGKPRKVDRHNPYAKQFTSQDGDLEKELNQENKSLVEDSDMEEAELTKIQEIQHITQTIPGFVEVPIIKLTEISQTFEEIFNFLAETEKQVQKIKFDEETGNNYEFYEEILEDYYKNLPIAKDKGMVEPAEF